MRFTKLLAFAMLCLPVRCFSQKSAEDILTLDSAIRLGIQNSKLLKASREKISIAIDKLKENNTQNNPRVTLNSTYTRISDNVVPFAVKFPGSQSPTVLNPQILNQFGENASVSQLIYSGMRVKKNTELLDYLVQASKQDYDNDRSTLVYNVINAYYSLYKLKETKRILAENKVLLDARISDLRNLEQNGIVLHNDVLKLQIQLSQLNVQATDINNSIGTTQYSFNILLGLPDSASLVPDTTKFFRYNLDRSYSDYEQLALTQRPDLLSADKRLKASVLSVDISRSAYLPTISATGAYNYLRPNQRVFPQEDAFKGTWAAGLSVVWDLSSLYNNRHYVNEARHTYDQNYLLKQNLVDNIKTDLYTNYLAYKRAIEHLALSQITLEQANENYKIIADRLQDNVVLATDLQDAITYLIQSEVNVLEDKADIDLAYFRFMKSAGALNF